MNDPSTITKLTKYLPPPFIGLDYVVRNEATGEVGYRWDRGGKIEYTWEFKDEKAAAKELAKI
jgi:hypothetical protein